jgi:hypothetical protein
MRTITGHVRNGYIVSDEPAEHPEGTPVLLRVVRAVLPNGEVLEGEALEARLNSQRRQDDGATR